LEKTTITIHQAFYGEVNRSHSCIRQTITDSDLTSFLIAFTDRPAALPPGVILEPYFSGAAYSKYYVLTKTFPDLSATRSGMVLTHVLIFNLPDIKVINDLQIALSSFIKSVDSKNDKLNELKIEFPNERFPAKSKSQPKYIQQIISAVINGTKPILFSGDIYDTGKVIQQMWASPFIKREKLKFRASFTPSDIEKTDDFTIVSIQKDFLSKWQGQTVISGDVADLIEIDSPSEELFLGHKEKNQFYNFLTRLNFDLTEVYLFGKYESIFKNYISIDDINDANIIRQDIRCLAQFSPSSNDGKEVKRKFVARLSMLIKNKKDSNLKALRKTRFASLSELINISATEKTQNWWHQSIKETITSIFKTENKKQQLIIATGMLNQWEGIMIDVPYQIFDFLPPTAIDWQQSFAKDLDLEEKEIEFLSPQEKDVYKQVVALDSFGISFPIDLLACSLNLQIKETLDLITAIAEKSLLNWIEIDSPASLLVSSNATEIAQAMIAFLNIQTSDLVDDFREIIWSVENDKKDERYTVLNLFQNALSGISFGHGDIFLSRANLRNLIDQCSDKLKEIWVSGDAIEHLLWGKMLEDLQRFDLSAEVFIEGLKTNANNPYLLQAQARMFGKWAMVEPAKMEKAEEFFDELTDSISDNPYFLQARGVFEANRNNPSEARNYFKDAMSVAKGEESKAYILTAWANLEIEEGNYATAEKRLNEITADSKSAYLPHIRAKLDFYHGDYQKAVENLKKLFAVRPLSIEGWHLVGEIAIKRGYWQKARTAFFKVLRIAPENVSALRALGDLETDLGRLASDTNQFEKAQEHFIKAEEFFAKALAAEPRNFITEVSRNVLWRYQGILLKRQNKQAEDVFDKSEESLTNLFETYMRNEFITHNLGELYLAKGLHEKAKRYFEVLSKQNKNLANLLGLAKAEFGLGNVEVVKQNLLEAEQMLSLSKPKHHERIRSLNSLAEVWLKLEDTKKAQNLVLASLELDKDNTFTLHLSFKIKQLSGDIKAAEFILNHAEDLQDKDLEDFLMEKK